MKVTEKLKKKITDYIYWRDLPAIACDCVERLGDIDPEDSDEIMQSIYEAVDDSVIYYDDQWEIIEWACSPVEANWHDAIDYFYDELYECVMRALEDYDEDEENVEDELNVK